MSDRRIEIFGKEIKTERGCPQGGVASPSLWNIGLNNLLVKLEKLKNVYNSAYADDNFLLIYSNSIELVETKLNVFLPIVTYAVSVWFDNVKESATKINKLGRIQRKIVNAITGAYVNTNSEKLLKLLNICFVDQELEIETRSRELNKSERRQYKALKRHVSGELLVIWKS